MGYRSKRRQSKTATTKTATHPKRRQPKRRHFQNGDNQNGDTSKTATTKTATRNFLSPFCIQVNMAFWISWIVAVLDLSPFWLYPKRRHAKTATDMHRFGCRRLGCRRFGCVAVLACRHFGCVAVLECRRFGLSPFWVSPFWIYRRFDLYPSDVEPRAIGYE